MARSKTTTSRESHCPGTPNWQPLERAAVRWLCGPFMAMGEVQLKNGAYVHCYKHADTRRSLHLTADGEEAYLYSFDARRPERSGRYERVSVEEAFARVVLLPQFEHGWMAGERWARGPVFDPSDPEGEGTEPDYYWSAFTEHMAEEEWLKWEAGSWPELT